MSTAPKTLPKTVGQAEVWELLKTISDSHPDEDTQGSNDLAQPVLHPSGTMAFQFGEILSGSPLVAFQAAKDCQPGSMLEKKQPLKQIFKRGREGLKLTCVDTQRTGNTGKPAHGEKRLQTNTPRKSA